MEPLTANSGAASHPNAAITSAKWEHENFLWALPSLPHFCFFTISGIQTSFSVWSILHLKLLLTDRMAQYEQQPPSANSRWHITLPLSQWERPLSHKGNGVAGGRKDRRAANMLWAHCIATVPQCRKHHWGVREVSANTAGSSISAGLCPLISAGWVSVPKPPPPFQLMSRDKDAILHTLDVEENLSSDKLLLPLKDLKLLLCCSFLWSLRTSPINSATDMGQLK